MGVTPPAWLNSLVRAVRWHRRGLGLIAAAICVVAVLTALDPSASSSHTVVIASRPLAAGVAVGADDVTTLQVPAEVATSATLADPGAAIGQVVAVPRPAGTVLTSSDFVGKGLVADSDGLTLVPFRIEDKGVAGVLGVGNQISVVGANPSADTRVIASRVRIAALPSPGSSGALDDSSSSSGALVIVAADSHTARELAAAASEYTLSVVLESD